MGRKWFINDNTPLYANVNDRSVIIALQCRITKENMELESVKGLKFQQNLIYTFYKEKFLVQHGVAGENMKSKLIHGWKDKEVSFHLSFGVLESWF